MLEGPCAERVHTRLLAPDPGNTGVGKAFLSLCEGTLRCLYGKGCFSEESIPFVLHGIQKERRGIEHDD